MFNILSVFLVTIVFCDSSSQTSIRIQGLGPDTAEWQYPWGLGPDTAEWQYPWGLGPDTAEWQYPWGLGPDTAEWQYPWGLGPDTAEWQCPLFHKLSLDLHQGRNLRLERNKEKFSWPGGHQWPWHDEVNQESFDMPFLVWNSGHRWERVFRLECRADCSVPQWNDWSLKSYFSKKNSQNLVFSSTSFHPYKQPFDILFFAATLNEPPNQVWHQQWEVGLCGWSPQIVVVLQSWFPMATSRGTKIQLKVHVVWCWHVLVGSAKQTLFYHHGQLYSDDECIWGHISAWKENRRANNDMIQFVKQMGLSTKTKDYISMLVIPVGFVLNLLTVVTFLRIKLYESPTGLHLFSLAVSEFLMFFGFGMTVPWPFRAKFSC